MTNDAEPRAALYAALAKAQGEFPTIPRDKTVTVQTRAGRPYTFSYAPLDTILEKVRPTLAANGLAVSQAFRGDDLVTGLLHASGESIESALPVQRGGGSWQEFGSAVTYARRYALVALLGIASEEDDDGNHAAGHTATSARRQPPPSPPPVRERLTADEFNPPTDADIPFGEPGDVDRLTLEACTIALDLQNSYGLAGKHEQVRTAAQSHREHNTHDKHLAWLERAIERLKEQRNDLQEHGLVE